MPHEKMWRREMPQRRRNVCRARVVLLPHEALDMGTDRRALPIAERHR
jgi:hypothetical protein